MTGRTSDGCIQRWPMSQVRLSGRSGYDRGVIALAARRAGSLLAALALLWACADSAAAQGGSLIQQAASCLATQPVCVEPGASPGLTPGEASALRQRIASEGAGPLYIAVLPRTSVNQAGGSMDQLLSQLASDVHQNGTYVAVADHHLRAASTGSEGFSGGELATAAVNAHRSQGLDAILTDLVDRVAAARSGSGGARPGGGSSGLGAGWILIAILAVGAGLLFLRQRRLQRAREQAEVDEVKQAAREDLQALGDDIRALDLDVEMPGADKTAKQSYNRAVELYDRANQQFERASRPQELAPVTSALEEGRYEMASAKALLEGRPAPERRPPCFFDPRHGPSIADVEWAPPGGAPRPVPACAACRQRVESGLEPDMRHVMVGGQAVPYWGAPAYYRPWAGGFFGGFGGGGFLGGLLLGEMFGGFGGWGDGDDYGGGFGGDGGGGFGGGDFGGGDFGGGGFGGGDFGGGGDGGGSF